MINVLSGTYILTAELWNLNVGDLPGLPIPRLLVIVLAAASLLAGMLAIFGYLSIGLVIQRAVEIKPRESD
jgi:hypothetical protein